MLNGLYFTSHDTMVRASFRNGDEIQHALGGEPVETVATHGGQMVTLLTAKDAQVTNKDFERNGLASHLFDTEIDGQVIVLGPDYSAEPSSLSDEAIDEIVEHVHSHVH